MKVYIIVQAGVYRHDIQGCYDNQPAAEARAQELASTDIDSHHEYVVGWLEMNEPAADMEIVGAWKNAGDWRKRADTCVKTR